MAKRLTDKEKKKLIADYIETGSYRAAGRKNGVAGSTVKRAVEEDKGTMQKLAQKKEEDIQDIFTYMDGKKEKVCEGIDKYLEALFDDEKIKAATLNQIATAMGIVIDKFTMNSRGQAALESIEDLKPLAEMLKK